MTYAARTKRDLRWDERQERALARTHLTGHERLLPVTDMIVSKTDTRGIMTYVNDVFLRISGYTEHELIGQPHALIRHPHMPRCVFKLLWDTIAAGEEIFAYVVNRAKNGDHYWVFAHVTPNFDPGGKLIGYHSNRRAPRREAIEVLAPLYQSLCAQEQALGGSAGMDAALRSVVDLLGSKGVSYPEFVLSL